MISDVDETLRRLLLEEVVYDRGSGAIRVTFVTSGMREEQPEPTVNLYLHDIRENRAQREGFFRRLPHPEDIGQAGRTRAPIRLDLSYLVTAEAGNNPEEEHSLLSATLAALLKHDTVPTRYLQGRLEGESVDAVQLTVATSDHASHSDLSNIWRSLGVPVKPAITLVATVTYDPFEPVWTRVVKEALLGLRQGTDPAARRDDVDLNRVSVSAAGIVTDAGGRIPLRDVLVKIKGLSLQTSTDERGFFFFVNVRPGKAVLVFELPGFRQTETAVSVPASGRSEEAESLVVALEPLSAEEMAEMPESARPRRELWERDRYVSFTRSGRVVYSDGTPAAFVPIRIDKRTTVTDASGVYRLADLPKDGQPVFAEIPGRGLCKLELEEGGGPARIPTD